MSNTLYEQISGLPFFFFLNLILSSASWTPDNWLNWVHSSIFFLLHILIIDSLFSFELLGSCNISTSWKFKHLKIHSIIV